MSLIQRLQSFAFLALSGFAYVRTEHAALTAAFFLAAVAYDLSADFLSVIRAKA